MLLAADIGNTNITLGAFEGKRLLRQWRLSTHSERTIDEYGSAIAGLIHGDFPDACVRASKAERRRTNMPHERRCMLVRAVVYGSVVPRLDSIFEAAVSRYLGARAHAVTPRSELGLRLKVDNPLEVGADRLLNGLAAYRLYGGPAVVLDFGTATTFDCISARGDYLGGAILIGPRLAAQALARHTAKLPEVDVRPVRGMIGKNTVECIQVGLYHGYVGMVEHILKGTLRDMEGGSRRAKVIATGGLAGLFTPALKGVLHVPELTLQGLRIAAETIS